MDVECAVPTECQPPAVGKPLHTYDPPGDLATYADESLAERTDLDGSDTSESQLDGLKQIALGPASRCSTCRSRRCILGLVILCVAVAVAVGVVFGGLYGGFIASGSFPTTVAPTSSPVVETTSPPTAAPTATPLSKDPLFKILESFSLSGLDDQSSPQFRAYEWLLNEDSLVNADSDPARIKQRYALITLYTATQSEIPFWASRNECTWPTIECKVPDVLPGLFVGTQNGTSTERATGKQVTHIHLARKSLEGTIPPEIGLLAQSLVHLDLSENSGLHGSIPAELYELTKLTSLHLTYNGMVGTLSESIGNLQALEDLYLGGNGFSGAIPNALGSRQGIRPLRYLVLYDNDLNGTIPLGLNLRNLFYMDLSFNNLRGQLPADIGSNFNELKQLYLDHNRFSGTIPESFTSISFGRIYVLTLNDNMLTGGIPTNWAKENKFLDTFNVQNNILTIPISGDICSFSALENGELVELGASCEICQCKNLCDKCYR